MGHHESMSSKSINHHYSKVFHGFSWVIIINACPSPLLRGQRWNGNEFRAAQAVQAFGKRGDAADLSMCRV